MRSQPSKHLKPKRWAFSHIINGLYIYIYMYVALGANNIIRKFCSIASGPASWTAQVSHSAHPFVEYKVIQEKR